MATLNIRLDDELKKEAFEVLEHYQISPSEFIRNIFRYVATEKRLPVKLVAFDQDNYAATIDLWRTYEKLRNVTLAAIDLLKQEKTIGQSSLAEIYASVDEFIQCSNEVVTQLTFAKQWADVASKLQAFIYQVKYQAMSSRHGSEYVMYSSEAVKEIGLVFYGIDREAHELLLHSRYV